MKSLIATLVVLVLILIGLSLIPQPPVAEAPGAGAPETPELLLVPYAAPALGLSFAHPDTYFAHVTNTDGERMQSTIVLFEDTPFTRALVNGEVPGTESPPAITVSVFQNDLDRYTAESFIRDNSNSNFKLSDGTLTPITVGGVAGYAYASTGLYESRNIVIARPNYVYMFSVGYNTPEDRILSDFETVLATVSFDAVRMPTSADGAPPGSIHNLPVPPAVSAVRAFAARKAGVSPESVIVMSAVEREWPDACLGLSGPDEMCAQMITPGYAVTVETGAGQQSFRVNSDGTVIVPEQ